MSSSTDDEVLVALHNRLSRMGYLQAVDGKEIYNFFGGIVLEQHNTAGHVLAIKVRPPGGIQRSEADMMHYAATHGVRAPKVFGFYSIVTTEPGRSIATAMVSERVPGVPLADIWLDLSQAEQSSVKEQLRAEIARMRRCTQPFIGRVKNQQTRNVYDRIASTFCGTFPTEKEFDNWCLARVSGGSLVHWRWDKWLERQRRQSSGTFVLTHGDLTPRNIMFKDGLVTGIIDWDRSGFFPEYAEYAFAMKLSHEHEKWWIPVLKQILEPCSKQRLKFTSLVEDRGW
ncbi:hypothetical protein VSDG_02367 [Cytospora chrysosperma]|uniref:Aminoglycoside phosphotransferase domain-containing protein n=1 Tax=Cytospora chrysosperma TaxID=252740 RepID=A0A423WFX1_CYTCH|nr:hypothetical protein VSDG_02367 [Valsa sordida]